MREKTLLGSSSGGTYWPGPAYDIRVWTLPPQALVCTPISSERSLSPSPILEATN